MEAQDNKFLPALRKISLTVRSGEILGIAGVAGNGQRELAEVVCGLRATTGGKITGGRPRCQCGGAAHDDRGGRGLRA